MTVETTDGMSHSCCRVGVMSILTEGGGDCAKVGELVVRDKPLGYDLLIGIVAIRELGSVVIRPTGEVQLGRKRKLCAAIMIEEQDFCTGLTTRKYWKLFTLLRAP